MKALLSARRLRRALVQRVQWLLDLLCEVEQHPALYTNRRTLRVALRRYEHVWVPLLLKAEQLGINPNTLAPPLDVQWVWMVHMLCPKKYAPDSRNMRAAACDAAAPHDMIDHSLMSRRRRRAALNRTRALWSAHFAHEPFENAHLHDGLLCEDGEPHAEQRSETSNISYDIVAACERQMMFHRQVAVLPQYRQRKFIDAAVGRYFMFLELKLKHQHTVLVPTFDTDIVWHTHMMHPINYRNHSMKVCNFIVPHDDTITNREDGADLEHSWHQTLHLWYAHFHTPFWRAGAMGRHNVTLQERLLKARICDAARAFEHELQRDWNGEPLTIKPFTFECAMEERTQWSSVEWVHAAQHRRLCTSAASQTRRRQTCTTLESTALSSCTAARLYSRTVCQSQSRVEQHARDDAHSTIMVEIFAHDTSAPHNMLALPVAAAYDIATNSMCFTSHTRRMLRTECALRRDEHALVVRVCGEDYAIIGARRDKHTRNVRLRVWYLNEARARWHSAHDVHHQQPRATYMMLRMYGAHDGAKCGSEMRVDDDERHNNNNDTRLHTLQTTHASDVLRAFALATAANAVAHAANSQQRVACVL